MIIIDTREQKPIWELKEGKVIKQKLDEGDYTTSDLLNIAHIERKSPNDFYGSIIQGHKRFAAELERANEKGIKLAVFVECPKQKFIGKQFKNGRFLRTPPKVLAKILSTMEEKYNMEIHWLKTRASFKKEAIKWFNQEAKLRESGTK